MIELSIIEFFTYPLLATLIMLIIISVYYDYRFHRHTKSKTDQTIYRCEQCDRIYNQPSGLPATKCPGCNHLNTAPKNIS